MILAWASPFKVKCPHFKIRFYSFSFCCYYDRIIGATSVIPIVTHSAENWFDFLVSFSTFLC